ncbi:MAG: cytidylate kinase [Deltaproteobacteria bacterium RBG_16_48_10]|nr:MAG: cytidylate kinase [Deltaproteobacteria bacterium RBG_16_48_10]
MKEKKKLTITIDGPTGAGKSTAAKGLAKRLGYLYIDTGAMYRAVALQAREKGARFEDEETLYQWTSSLQITFLSQGEEVHILCNGRDVTQAIRLPEISLLASEISKRRGVRDALVQMQREMGQGGGVVLEGRDTGTVVFPQADVKFYLDAKAEERARRRYEELAGKGVKVHFKETLEEAIHRDQNDTNRSLSPLRKAEDAILIDSTHRSAEEVIEVMVRFVQRRRR